MIHQLLVPPGAEGTEAAGTDHQKPPTGGIKHRVFSCKQDMALMANRVCENLSGSWDETPWHRRKVAGLDLDLVGGGTPSEVPFRPVQAWWVGGARFETSTWWERPRGATQCHRNMVESCACECLSARAHSAPLQNAFFRESHVPFCSHHPFWMRWPPDAFDTFEAFPSLPL